MSMRTELEKVLSQLRYADETHSEAAEQDSICMNEDFLAKYGQELLALTGGSTDSATLTQLIAMFRQREQLGLAKYGTTVDRTDLTPAQWRQHHREELMDALFYSLAEEREDSFQARVSTWMGQCFLPSLYSDMTERGDRLLEEVLELLQSKGYDRSRVATLVDYVYGRPPGEPSQEVGGVMVTLAGYCWIAGLDMHADGERELVRINQPEVMAKIRAKQEAKNALHFDTPLPGSAREVPHG